MKIHQAQAKNFCRVLDIRVPEGMRPPAFNLRFVGVFPKRPRHVVAIHRPDGSGGEDILFPLARFPALPQLPRSHAIHPLGGPLLFDDPKQLCM